jgi:hypothetical protein
MTMARKIGKRRADVAPRCSWKSPRGIIKQYNLYDFLTRKNALGSRKLEREIGRILNPESKVIAFPR